MTPGPWPPPPRATRGVTEAARPQVKLVNIRNDDIADGNPKLTLGLIWTIILHFQVEWPPSALCCLWGLRGRPGSWALATRAPGAFPPPAQQEPCVSCRAPRPRSLSKACLSRALWAWPGRARRASPQRNALCAPPGQPPALGKALEKQRLHWLTHLLPAQPHRKPQI